MEKGRQNNKPAPRRSGAVGEGLKFWLRISTIVYFLFFLLSYLGFQDLSSFMISFAGLNCAFLSTILFGDYLFKRQYGWSLLDKLEMWVEEEPEPED